MPSLAQHRRRFEADIAAADHDDAADVRQFGQHGIDIGAAADRVNAGKIAAGAGEAAGYAAGRPDQSAIADPPRVPQHDLTGRRIDRGGRHAEDHLHGALAPKGGRADQNALERLLARQIILRERRALIGQLRLGADHADAACEAELAERDRGLRAAMPRAHDQDVIIGHASN